MNCQSFKIQTFQLTSYISILQKLSTQCLIIDICKIRRKGIGGNIPKWIEDFLLKRTQKVKINGVKSENVEVSSSVPQGSVLRSLLFLIYIDDLPCKITSCQIFADDTKIYGPISTATQHQSMQKNINHMMEWSETWLFRFNTTKCKVMQEKAIQHEINDGGR